MAGTFRDRKARGSLSHMAEAWLRLADRDQRARKEQVRKQQQIQRKDEDPVWGLVLTGRKGSVKHRSRGTIFLLTLKLNPRVTEWATRQASRAPDPSTTEKRTTSATPERPNARADRMSYL
jgi:hypothetical protein